MTVFWDIDDTIYSRGDPFLKACGIFFDQPLEDPYGAYLTCTRRGDEVFKASQTGEISMDEMYIYRYCRGFGDVGIDLTPEEALRFQDIYYEALEDISCSDTMRRTLDLCRTLARQTGIVTNGPSVKQRRKIAFLDIEKYMDPELIIVSGETGFDKPEKEIFLLAQEKCGESPEQILYIGDSPQHDILPAAALGWRTVWFNRRRMDPAACAGYAEHTVMSEEELLDLLPDAVCT